MLHLLSFKFDLFCLTFSGLVSWNVWHFFFLFNLLEIDRWVVSHLKSSTSQITSKPLNRTFEICLLGISLLEGLGAMLMVTSRLHFLVQNTGFLEI